MGLSGLAHASHLWNRPGSAEAMMKGPKRGLPSDPQFPALNDAHL
jgi:hypothetical protein